MDEALRQEVRRRAGAACEYCQIPEELLLAPFQMDHIIARQHGGNTVRNNLAFSCAHCNRHKGPNIAGRDPQTGQAAPLFHPRRDRWEEHFQWNGAELTGRTAIGRATVAVLGINLWHRLRHRQALIDEDLFPPQQH